MMTRKEIETLLGCSITDEQWEENKKKFEEYEKEHNYDDMDE